jgi:histone-lysine N-methyltransferase SUV39H
MNILMEAENKNKFKLLIKKIVKTTEETLDENDNVIAPSKDLAMWGIFTMEDIPAGAFMFEYTGEVLTKKEGDQRGRDYDKVGMSYLFDMNDPDDKCSFEMNVQNAYNKDFFPLCIDAAYCGNESRFVNHSCMPNLKSFNISVDVESQTYHRVAFFASKNIPKGKELTIDYCWDKNDLDIEESVLCLCGTNKCRVYLMRAKKKSQR